YQYWTERAHSFQSLACAGYSSLTFTGDQPENANGRSVSESFFQTIDVRPVLGRTFDHSEYATGAARTVILSDDLWRRHFGADPGIIGKQVPVAGGSALVVGVMPRGFGSLPYGEQQYLEPLTGDASTYR